MFESLETRDRDFLRTYSRLRKRCRGERLTASQLVKRAVETEAPSYYVTFDYAYRMLRLLRNGRIPRRYSDIKRQQWEEIKNRVDSTRKRYRMRDDSSALSLVLADGRASRFFISPAYALRLLQNLNQNN